MGGGLYNIWERWLRGYIDDFVIQIVEIFMQMSELSAGIEKSNISSTL